MKTESPLRGFTFLTEEDANTLMSIGVPDEDLKQIDSVLKVTTFEKETEDKLVKISMQKALEILGRKMFLSGLNRAAFHFTSSCEAEDGTIVYMDASRYFKSKF